MPPKSAASGKSSPPSSPKSSKASAKSAGRRSAAASPPPSKASAKSAAKTKSPSPGPPSKASSKASSKVSGKASSKASSKPGAKKSAASTDAGGSPASPTSKASTAKSKASAKSAARTPSSPKSKPSAKSSKPKSSLKASSKDPVEDEGPSPVPSEPDLQMAPDAVPPPDLGAEGNESRMTMGTKNTSLGGPLSAPITATASVPSTVSTEKDRKMLIKHLVLRTNKEVDECTQALRDADWDAAKAQELLSAGVLTAQQREVELTKLIRFFGKYKPGSATREEAMKTLELYDNPVQMWEQLTGVYGPIPSEPLGAPLDPLGGGVVGYGGAGPIPPSSPFLQDGLPPPPQHEKQALASMHSFRAATLAGREYGSPDLSQLQRGASFAGSGVGLPPQAFAGAGVGLGMHPPHSPAGGAGGVSPRGGAYGSPRSALRPAPPRPHFPGTAGDPAPSAINPAEQLLALLQHSPWLIPGLAAGGAGPGGKATGRQRDESKSGNLTATTETSESSDYDETTETMSFAESTEQEREREQDRRRPRSRDRRRAEPAGRVDYPPPPRHNVSFRQVDDIDDETTTATAARTDSGMATPLDQLRAGRGGGRGYEQGHGPPGRSASMSSLKGGSAGGGKTDIELLILEKIKRIEQQLNDRNAVGGSASTTASDGAPGHTPLNMDDASGYPTGSAGLGGITAPHTDPLASRGRSAVTLREPDLVLPDLPPPPPPIPDTPEYGFVMPPPPAGPARVVEPLLMGGPPPPPPPPGPPPPPLPQAGEMQKETEAIRARTRATAELTRKLRQRHASLSQPRGAGGGEEGGGGAPSLLTPPVAVTAGGGGRGPPLAHRESPDHPLRAGLPPPTMPPPPPPAYPPPPTAGPAGNAPPPPLAIPVPHSSTGSATADTAVPAGFGNAALGGLLSTMAGTLPTPPVYDGDGGGLYAELLERQKELLAKQQESQEQAKVRVLERELETLQKKYAEAQHRQLDQLEVIKKIQAQVALNDAVTRQSVENLGELSDGVRQWAGEVHAQQQKYFDDANAVLQNQASQHAQKVQDAHAAAVQKGVMDMAHLTRLAGEQNDLVQRVKDLAAERVALEKTPDPLHERAMADKLGALESALESSQARQAEYEQQLSRLTDVITRSAGVVKPPPPPPPRALPAAERPADAAHDASAGYRAGVDPRVQAWADNTSTTTTTLPPAPTPAPESCFGALSGYAPAAAAAQPQTPVELARAAYVDVDSEAPGRVQAPPHVVPHHDPDGLPGGGANPYHAWGQRAVPVMVAPPAAAPQQRVGPPPASHSVPPQRASTATPWEALDIHPDGAASEARSQSSGSSGENNEVVLNELQNLREVLRLLVHHQVEQCDKQEEIASQQAYLLERQQAQDTSNDDIAKQQALLLHKQRLNEIRDATEKNALLESLKQLHTAGQQAQPQPQPRPATTPALPPPPPVGVDPAPAERPSGRNAAPPSHRTFVQHPITGIEDAGAPAAYPSTVESIPGLPSHVLAPAAPVVNVIHSGRRPRSSSAGRRSGSVSKPHRRSGSTHNHTPKGKQIPTTHRTPGAVAADAAVAVNPPQEPSAKRKRSRSARGRTDSPARQFAEGVLRDTGPRGHAGNGGGSPRVARLQQSLHSLSDAVAQLKRSGSRSRGRSGSYVDGAARGSGTHASGQTLDTTPRRSPVDINGYRPPPTPPAENPHRRVLEQFYTRHDPSKIKNIPTILEKFAGHENTLFHSLAKKYNIKLNPYREQLIAFYARHNPVELCHVDVVLHLAEGHEEKLMKRLGEMYAE